MKRCLFPPLPLLQLLLVLPEAGSLTLASGRLLRQQALPPQPLYPSLVLPHRTRSLSGALPPEQMVSMVPFAHVALLRPAMTPILTIVALCILGMVPSGFKAFLSQSSNRKLHRRVFTGCTLGAVVSMWIFSGTWSFLLVFAAMAVVAQNEYYLIARQNGCYPTWKLGILGSCGMYVAACSTSPVLREAIFPITGTITILYLLLRQEPKTPPTSMNDVATTFMGIYYFGFMPAFWVRLRSLGAMRQAELLPAVLPSGSCAWHWPFIGALLRSPADFFTWGALVQWWTMFSIVTADVAAYFAGKRFGRTRLIDVSPNKTWEGLAAGCIASVVVMAVAAKLMRWPRPLLTGPFYGIMIAVMALLGDLTVSLLKRSAGVKVRTCASLTPHAFCDSISMCVAVLSVGDSLQRPAHSLPLPINRCALAGHWFFTARPRWFA
jgi:phosphatidate cytidylyltransferase